MSQQQQAVLGYLPRNTFVHRLSGASKLICFLILSVITMTSYDTRFLLGVSVFAVVLMYFAKIRWRDIRMVVYIVTAISLINLVMIYIFEPEYGVDIYQSRTVLWEGIGRYSLTWEQLFYELNIAIKYFATIPFALIFMLTTNPSEFASSLNRVGVSYRIAYAVSLTLRYIPDIQQSYLNIRQAQQARGIEMSEKASLVSRIKHSAQIIMPLIFSSLERIEVISQAMTLRRFGKEKKRSWYSAKPFDRNDVLAIMVTLAITAVGVYCFVINQGRFYNPFG
ncbi:energy-coupling factor transporter transmembrane component T family protein [Fundicoccus culcitae]|uniref:Energy-coupling factor transporter transmembrane protein EcfT n=1 Tax=Fundicoccus culcitae TaxID=2969821 RepID=A0ABY5P5M5_9LACT|nr:energy-coupling factor transporter transmembrane component T [Fundicoccus culcitae]UUX33675.1 energy-coupling factor transporter transmembrane protein EcfT [Fundicoccus culcitae]